MICHIELPVHNMMLYAAGYYNMTQAAVMLKCLASVMLYRKRCYRHWSALLHGVKMLTGAFC